MTTRMLILAALAVLAQPAQATPPDERIRLLPYEPDQVVTLAVSPGYAAVVELSPGEAIENVVVGNSAVWQITANSSSDRIIVKPLANATATNMIVVTDARRYAFLLDTNGGASQGLFVLRFSYPETSSAASASSAAAATYKLSGAKNLFPVAMHDDGKRTIITWKDQASLPAVFAVADGGREAIVNGRMVGSDFVVEGTSPKFVFRLGDARAVASRKMLKTR